MKNECIRQAAKSYEVRHWQIADEMGISEFHLSHKLRKELPEEEQERILAIIERIKDGAAS